MAPSTLRTALSLVVALALPATARAQGAGYEADAARAATLEAQGLPRDAARALDPWAARLPDDHALALRLGWLHARGGEHAAARDHYARALRLSEGESLDARLGLAWARLNSGDATGARADFDAVLARDPRNASAAEGLPLARAAEPRMFRLHASLWTGAQVYAGHPSRRDSVSIAPSLTLTVADAVLVGATWRGIAYGTVSSNNGRAAQTSSFQQELFATVGYVRPSYTLQLHYGHVWDAANSLLPAHVFGASARVALRGELSAELSATAYPDGTRVRALGAWAARLSDAWSLGPTASAQAGVGGLGGSIGAALTWRHPAAAVTLAGRYSDETRVTSLNESLTFATSDRVLGALSVTARVPLGRGLSLAPSYEWLRLQTTGASVRDVDAHFFTVGLTGAW